MALLAAAKACSFRTQYRMKISAVLIIQSIIATALTAGLLIAVVHGQGRVDYRIFFSAAEMLRDSPANLYDVELQARRQQIPSNNFLPFAYPAIVAGLFLPLTWLGSEAGYVVLLIISIALCIAALMMLSSGLDLDQTRKRLLMISAAAFLPVYVALHEGQLSFLFLFIYAMAVLKLRSGKMASAGAWSGLLMMKPSLFPVLPFWFLIRRDWAALKACALTAAAVLVISFLLVGPGALPDYIKASQTVLETHRQNGLVELMPNLRSLTSFFGWNTAAWLAAVALVLSGLVWLAHRRPLDDRSCAAMLIATILVAPHFMIYDLTIALVLIAIALPSVGYWVMVPLLQLPALVVMQLPVFRWPFLPVVLLLIFGYIVITSRGAPVLSDVAAKIGIVQSVPMRRGRG
jgi:glycosyl transferase family 87